MKRQSWMADEEEFFHLKNNITRVKKLTEKYQDHSYSDEFARNMDGLVLLWYIYFRRKKLIRNFSVSETWNLMNYSEELSSMMKR